MSMPIPQQTPDVSVDPNAVLQQLRQQHAQECDGLRYQVAVLTVALNDAHATLNEQRIRAEELASENAALRQRHGDQDPAAH